MDSDIFYKHKYDILVIVIMTFLFNYKFGLVCMILYILIYTLTNAKIKIYNEEKLINTSKKRCRPNSYDNPYGNFIFGSNPEIYDCDDSIIKDSNNQINLYENTQNKKIGSINKGLRDFYTMPVTTYPNNQIAFAKYLMPTSLSCKTDGYCVQYDDLRYHTR